MGKHNLKLHIPQVMEPCVLQVVDLSTYDADIAVSCPTLQVLPPDFNTAALLNDSTTPQVTPGFSLNLNACHLDLQTESCGFTFDPLPDGLYVIKYSVSPNDIVYVEINHLRITNALIKWRKLLCDLDLIPALLTKEKASQLDKLMEVRGYLEAAVSAIEICGTPKKGLELFHYALSLMDKMTCFTC